MTYIFSFLLALYVALGASCSRDLTRLQHMIEGYDYSTMLEPTSSLFIFISNLISPFLGASILHLISVLILLLSFRFYFLQKKIITNFQFYIISFIAILNPFSFELVSANTRQLLMTSLLSIPTYSIVSSYLTRKIKFNKNCKTYRKKYNLIFPSIL